MICLNCGNKLKGDEHKCPVCGYEKKEKPLEFELPVLKAKEDVIELDDTDTNLSDNDFEIELKDAPEDDSFDKFDVKTTLEDDESHEDDGAEEESDEIDQNIELEDDINLEKTRSISPISDEEEISELSFIDDINKQIDEVNSEAQEEIVSLNSNEEEHEPSIEYKEETTSVDDSLKTADSLKKRKNIFMITGIVFLLLAIIVFIVLLISNSNKKEDVKDTYLEDMASALQTYYDTGEIDDIIYVLEDVKGDADKVKKIQAKTRTVCDSWMLLYFDEETIDKEEFESISEKYKGLINGLHSYALVKNNNLRIKALNDTDYDELIRQANDIYSDSVVYFDALSYYNEKDYNRSYYGFDRIEESNRYYEKAISYKNKIIDNIMEILNNDIKKIEAGIENLDDKDKLVRYTEIESIIFEYNNVYSSVELSSSEEYQSLLNTYTSKVSEYNDKVGIQEQNSIENYDEYIDVEGLFILE